MVHLILLADCPPQPWRNGGGLTRELLAWPATATQPAPAWQVRVSVAEITQDGPFSAYPGIHRAFAVLQGAGVVLTLHGRTSITLTPASPPWHFAGAEAPDCRLVSGPTQDLNLMVRTGAGRASMRRAERGSRCEAGARWRGLYTAESATVRRGALLETLAPGSLLWADEPGEVWHLQSGAAAWWLEVAAEGGA